VSGDRFGNNASGRPGRPAKCVNTAGWPGEKRAGQRVELPVKRCPRKSDIENAKYSTVFGIRSVVGYNKLPAAQQSNKATKQQSNEATKQRSNEATKQRSNEATKQRSNEAG
jgi:hypothetical protein